MRLSNRIIIIIKMKTIGGYKEKKNKNKEKSKHQIYLK